MRLWLGSEPGSAPAMSAMSVQVGGDVDVSAPSGASGCAWCRTVGVTGVGAYRR